MAYAVLVIYSMVLVVAGIFAVAYPLQATLVLLGLTGMFVWLIARDRGIAHEEDDDGPG